MASPHTWFVAFLITVVAETPIVVYLTRGHATSLPRRVLMAVFAQLVTHPLVWFVFPYIVGITGRTAMTLSEAWAWLAEALFYAVVLPGLSPARALGISAIANAASILAGLALH